MRKYLKPYWLIDHLPALREWRLIWLRSYLNLTFGRDLKAAREAKNQSLEERIHNDWQVEIAFIDDEEAERFSRGLLRTAQRLRVPTPDHYNGNKLSADYEETSMSSKIVLSTVGAQKVLKEIREEQKWRSEARARFIPYITVITGLVGTLTGLLAVWSKWGR